MNYSRPPSRSTAVIVPNPIHSSIVILPLDNSCKRHESSPVSAIDLPPEFFERFPAVTGPRPPAKPGAQKGGTVEQWVAVARDVLADKWRDADDSTRKSLVIGLRNIDDVTCQNAHAMLKGVAS